MTGKKGVKEIGARLNKRLGKHLETDKALVTVRFLDVVNNQKSRQISNIAPGHSARQQEI